MFIEGIVDIIRVPIAFILKICSDFANLIGLGNYLFALLFFAIIMQIILVPFAIKQQKNSIKQARLAPKVAAIRNKYKGRTDKATQQKIQEETQALYQKENFNPMGGCLPLVIQMPILFALFRVITMPMRYLAGIHTDVIQKMVSLSNGLVSKGAAGLVEIKANEAYAQIKLVSNLRALGENGSNALAKAAGATDFNFKKLPDFTLFGGKFDLSLAPKDMGIVSWYIAIPIITVLALIFSQWLTKKFTYQDPAQQQAQQGCSMKVMMYAMPLLSGYFAYLYAAAIGIYWIFRNLLALVQQIILSKAMPLPVFTEEDYKEAEREMYKTQTKKKKSEDLDPNRPKPRSLHHIDDDDGEYEYLASGGDERATRYDTADDEPPAEVAKKDDSVENEAAVDADVSEGTKLNGVDMSAPIKDDKHTVFKKKKKK
ncbi:MAG: YidC/Oxa1 family membrane protein insertase [Clostridia bacterium]|nr:YidC/Oxa1 family membrane protein insertase [Clostridia bacterium]